MMYRPELLHHSDGWIAAENRKLLRGESALLFQLAGVPGAGRSTLLAATVRRLTGQAEVGVILTEPVREADRPHLTEHSRQIVKVDRPSLDAAAVQQALGQMDLKRLEWIFCEGLGAAASNAVEGETIGDVGQNLTVGVFSVAGGDDKAASLSRLAREADAVVLTQADLLPHVPFSMERFERDLRRANADTPLFVVSALHGTGMPEWIEWLRRYRISKSAPAPGADWDELMEIHGEWYFG
jgi:hydrogenase nickel incorporation protein HypB